jgi:hypothetical protein
VYRDDSGDCFDGFIGVETHDEQLVLQDCVLLPNFGTDSPQDLYQELQARQRVRKVYQPNARMILL